MNNPNLYYGIHPMSVENEMKLPEPVSLTRFNKIRGIDMLTVIEKEIPSCRDRLRKAPELNDSNHAKLIQEYVDAIIDAYKALDRLCGIGR